ncbi:MAG: hypothetical protein K2K25_05900 [Muribaculaceae bacterium]|nr:hypothetical protein [Muribaculaceae bacterium]
MKKNIIRYIGIFLILTLFSSCNRNSIADAPLTKEAKFFNSFQNFPEYASKYRVGLKTDSVMFNFQIRAMMTARFDSTHFSASTIYVLKHTSGDSIVIKTPEMPLLTHEQFSSFFHTNKESLKADTLINPDFVNKFYIHPTGKIDIEQIQYLPFAFMDVNFNGYPALLIRKPLGSYKNDYYKFDVYGISKSGFKKVSFEPYNMIKNRTDEWCYGGSTEFDYDKKTITIHSLEPESCCDYGTLITQIYILNTSTDKFDTKTFIQKYDFDH